MKKHNKLFLGLIILVFQLSCSYNKHLVGEYSSPNKHEKLVLNSDSTFHYEFRYLHFKESSIGKWIQKGKTVYLSSSLQTDTISFLITKLDYIESNENIININLLIENGSPLKNYKCRLLLNESEILYRRADSLKNIKFSKPLKIVSLTIFKEALKPTSNLISAPIVVTPLILSRELNNCVTLQLNIREEFFFNKTFSDEEIRVRRNSLKKFNSTIKKWEFLKRL